MSTVVVSSYTPALGTGRGVRTYGVVRALAVHGPVEVLYTPFGADAPGAAFTTAPGVTLTAVPRSRLPARALAYARGRSRRWPEPVARSASPALAAAAAERDGARIVVDDIPAAAALLDLARKRPLTFSAHNLESAFRTDWGPNVADFERTIFETYAESWLPSRADLDGARSLAPGATLRYVPNVVDVAAITPVAAQGRIAMFLADFTYGPNREGFEWLTGEVLPLVGADVEIRVAGRGLDAPAGLDPRIKVLGFVDDLETVYADAACALVPLLHGGGSPLKFVEALAHGLPVVATPRAAAGLDVVAGEHYVEGDGPAEFAAAIERALDPATGPRVGAAGRALAEREYSVESLARRVAP